MPHKINRCKYLTIIKDGVLFNPEGVFMAKKKKTKNKKTNGTNGNSENGGNKKPQKRSLFDMLRGISSRKTTVEKRPIFDQIHGIGRKGGGGRGGGSGFSVAAYMTGGMIVPAHHATATGVQHKGNLRRG